MCTVPATKKKERRVLITLRVSPDTHKVIESATKRAKNQGRAVDKLIQELVSSRRSRFSKKESGSVETEQPEAAEALPS